MTALLQTPTTRDAAAAAIDVVTTYGRGDTAVHALDSASLVIARGRFTAVRGPSAPRSALRTLSPCQCWSGPMSSGYSGRWG